MILPSTREPPRLTNFTMVRPAHLAPQRDLVAWLARAHTEAERAGAPAGFDEERFHAGMTALFARIVRAGDIATRGFEIADCTHARWEDMSFYDLRRRAGGPSASERAARFTELAERALDALYAAEDAPPRDLVHVTCTGYASPSAAQRFVARRGWRKATRVTHAYQMGCYAAIPAVRIAAALASPRADVAHDEVCSLHLRFDDHAPQQLVVQSLFGDGHVRYAVMRGPARGPSLVLLAAREELAPDSLDAMTWSPSDGAMRMTLARDVPQRVAAEARAFVLSLFDEAGLDAREHLARTVFALHPGGPKILDALARALELDESRIAASREVLRRRGNMSSATLPHVWMDLLADPKSAPPGTLLASLAFGPGITVAGALMVVA